MDIYNNLKMYLNLYTVNYKWNNADKYLIELKNFRRDLMKDIHIMIMFDGRKGTDLEYQLSLEMRSIILPVKSNSPSEIVQKAIKNEDVVSNIAKYDANYVEKLLNRDKTALEDILECIKNILGMK